MNTIDPRYKQAIITIISRYLPTCTIYLYGSRARNTQQQGSDVDIALDNGSPIAWTIIAKIRADFEETTVPLTIDLVDVHATDAAFLAVITKDWIAWNKT